MWLKACRFLHADIFEGRQGKIDTGYGNIET